MGDADGTADTPFFFLPPSDLDLAAALRVDFSLGMMGVDSGVCRAG